ncbi:MAG: A/G-specific adenine glycosylase [Desulfobacterales bacterium]
MRSSDIILYPCIPDIRKSLTAWYNQHRRTLPWRDTRDPYAIWVSEVMLQQTRVNTVIPFYSKFLSAFPNIHALARAEISRVLKIWEGLGYYGRALRLHEAAHLLIRDFQGHMPEAYEDLRRLPGVGDYIASAVLSMAFDQPHAAVDGNVKRVLSRILCEKNPVNASSAPAVYKTHATRLLDADNPGMFNQAMMELGALVCVAKKPVCGKCPIRLHCRALQNRCVHGFPKRRKTGRIPEHHISVGVVMKKGRLLITLRKPGGLLGGLWEFPGGRVENHETPEQACMRHMREMLSVDVRVERFLTRVRHTYSHFKIVMDVFICRWAGGRLRLNGPEDYQWITPSQVHRYAFHKANHKFFSTLWESLANR